MAALKSGDRINNYLLEARVGAGSFGEVWRARHHVFRDVVAVKVPTDHQYVRNLQREGVAVHGIHHPNIVRAIDLDPFADPPYLIMEYVDGPSLRAAVEQFGSSFPIPAVTAILRGMLHALAAAHRAGVIHRDLKPENVLLQHSLERLAEVAETAVKVTDFGLGLSGGLTAQSMMQSGSLMTDEGRGISGTVAYMSPEQREGKPVDARSDLYSCGIVLFEMLIGERPQGTDLPGAIRPDVPHMLDRVFQRSYTRYERRFATAEEMLRALPQRLPLPASGQGRPVSHAAPRMLVTSRSTCPVCDDDVHPEDQFCVACGVQLVHSVPRCPSCHAFVQRADRYCIFCGHSLEVRVG